TTVNSTTITVDDKNIILASGAANDAAADGGGITVESGQGDKTFNWVDATDSWTSSEHMNLLVGKSYKIAGNNVITSTTLGSGIVNSSLTSVGTLGSLRVSGISTLGTANATTINKVTITAPATASTLTIADGKTLTASNTLTFTGTDASSVAFGAGGTVAYTSNKLSAFSATTSSEFAGVISDETGSGALVFATSPTLVTPVLGAATGTSLSLSGVCTATDFNSTSDRNLKDNIRPVEGAADLVGKLEGVHFSWKSNGQETIGVIAQQIEEHLPQLVQTGNTHKTVNYNGLIGVLIEAVKEQGKMIADLKAEIEELKK
ncbi:tail fiber domain-containing protein, partial [bacterium]|nr:tail fiber domain-containing protein [bacterium]